jgi:uncharacterized membrane protein YfcA
MELLPIVLIAFLVALIFSMLGLGGAIIYTPLFIFAGLPVLKAIPMALLMNTITTISASIIYYKQRMIDTGIAYPIIVTSVPGALAGSYIARMVEPGVIILILSIILFFAGVRLLFFNNIGISIKIDQNKKIISGMLAGFLIGTISSMVGIGGGTFIVPLLLIYGFETKNATATSSFIITFIALSGFLGHISFGDQQMDTGILLSAGTAAFIGAQAGSRILKLTSSKTIERMFALVLLLVVGKLVYGLLWP